MNPSLRLRVSRTHRILGLVALIPLILLSRFVSVGLPIAVLRPLRKFTPYTVTILTWSGIRGGISIALALSLPASPYRDGILLVTYVIVVFSIPVQGLTIARLTRWVAARS